jgi:hypothetical protein
MSAIGDKWQALKAAGLDLGSPKGPESTAASGGMVQEFQLGNIYYHPSTGAHEVHGGILARYLAAGGPGRDPATGHRVLGYPVTDERDTADRLHRESRFEWGTILWAFGGNMIYGPLYQRWIAPPAGEAAAAQEWGYPVQDQVPFQDGGAAYFERGAWYAGPASSNEPVACRLRLPMIGRPAIWDTDAASSTALPFGLHCTGSAAALQQMAQHGGPELVRALWNGRLLLRQVGESGPARHEVTVECRVGALPGEESFDPVAPLHLFLPAGSRLHDRTLYDVVFRRSDGRGEIMLAPHALYSKTDWSSFGFIHATDLHASRRLDAVRAKLRGLGLTEGARQFHNYNDAFRDLVRYANHLHAIGLADVVLATGDLVDYEFEVGDPAEGNGNFGFFKNILLGKVPYPDAETAGGGSAEELRIPIFTVPGNHDYRRIPYPLILDISAPLDDPTLENFASHNLIKDEAVRLGPGGHKPTLSRDEAHAIVDPDQEIAAYHRTINDRKSYTVDLGKHRVVMLNTGWDVGVIGSGWTDLISYYFNGSESERNFAAGDPDQRGLGDTDLDLVRRALAEVPAHGLVMIGMHAGPINPSGNERGYYFRETVHARTDQRQVDGFLMRRTELTPLNFTFHLPTLRGAHEGWAQRRLSSIGRFFKYGETDDLLDYGSAQGLNEDLLRLCAGVGVPRRADLVLFGHTHANIEYRVAPRADGRLEYYHDFYSGNPSAYYPCKVVDATAFHGDFAYVQEVKDRTSKVAVNVAASGTVNPAIANVHRSGYEVVHRVVVPEYADALDRAPDPAAWWGRHRPLLMQTPGLGPLENSQRERTSNAGLKVAPDITFNGFRVGLVTNDTIRAIHMVRLAELRASRFRLAWEPVLQLPTIPAIVTAGAAAPVG